jgi:diadenosine tetraphosphate (Ap4A) HIT family hydrolase
MTTAIHRAVEAAQRSANPSVIARLPSGWVVMAEKQVVRGYCLLLPDPVVPDLNALDNESRANFLRDMAIVGDALLEVTGAARINYEILGNLEPALHAHVLPRYPDEPEETRTKPVWFKTFDAAPAFDPERDATLMRAIATALRKLGARIE